MALPMLVGGPECGPSNPLQGLSKRFDSDRGLQQDYFGANRASSSQEGFRSQSSIPLHHDQGVAQFFAKSPPPQFSGSNAYDLGAIQRALPAADVQQLQRGPVADWAADFMTQQPMQVLPSSSQQALALQSPVQSSSTTPISQAPLPMLHTPQVMPWNNGVSTWGMGMRTTFSPPSTVSSPQAVVQNNQILWDKEFDAQNIDSKPATVVESSTSQKEESRQHPQEQDELARTAGLLLESVKAEQNPKFQNSQFMNLMTQLRDRKVVVRGNEMVENDETTVVQDSRIDLKGKGKAIDVSFGNPTALQRTSMTVEGLPSERFALKEDANEAYFIKDNEDYMRYWNAPRKSEQRVDRTWDQQQKDWDGLEASSSAIKPVVLYQFQQNNPYLHGGRTRHHSMHTDERLETVLELEANVQRNMNDASAWFELGVKQQEQEREAQALRALFRATELDPSYLPGWLALSVSFTNDGRRLEAYDAIREWVMRNDQHRDVVQLHLSQHPESENASPQEKFNHLVQCLIKMAQKSAVGQIDADIQNALAVLFNSNEDYEKAQDCFVAALSVRPDDWQLYNRVGATMANSGKAAAALEYYYRALELNPVYIRARYNLGISCINLKRYEEGAQHILDALSLQDAEGVHDPEGLNNARGGITSSALWDSLKTACLHMQRAELCILCDKRDLEAFRFNFQLR